MSLNNFSVLIFLVVVLVLASVLKFPLEVVILLSRFRLLANVLNSHSHRPFSSTVPICMITMCVLKESK